MLIFGDKEINMLRLLTTICLAFLSSCAPHYYIYEVKNVSKQVSNGKFFAFENDTVKITYSFWAENGTMAFSVYNKLNIPIYIDWKKSSMVRNGSKVDYWKDEVRNSGSYFSNLFSGIINDETAVSIGQGVWSSRTMKPERITFLTPSSGITRVQSKLFIYPNVPVKKPYSLGTLERHNGDKTSALKYNSFNEENSPLSFRNFLTLSTREDFTNETYVDNYFYVANIYDANSRELLWKRNNKGQVEWTLSNPKWFFVK